MRRALLAVIVLAAGCGGEEPERELTPGRVRIGVVDAERLVVEGARVEVNRIDNAGGIGGAVTIDLVRGSTEELLAQGVRLLVLPCRRGLVAAARHVERARAAAVAPCDDGVLPRALRRVAATGLSPRAQADALAEFVGDDRVRVLRARTARGSRVRRLLRVDEGGRAPVGVDAPERVEPPRDVPDGTVFATYGFPDPGSRTDEFYERFRAVYGRRPETIVAALAASAVSALAVAIESAASTQPALVAAEFREGVEVRGALGEIEFPGETLRARVDAAIVRVEEGRLRSVDAG